MVKDAFEELDGIKPMVIQKLRDVPATRDSDTLLYFSILKDYYKHMGKRCSEGDFLDDLNDLIRFAPNKSSISRVKRRIQASRIWDHVCKQTWGKLLGTV